MATTSAGKAGPPSSSIDPWRVPGVIGSDLARHATDIEDVLAVFHDTRQITRSQLSRLRHAATAARRIATVSQQLSRLAGGRLRQSHEKLSLDGLVRQALADLQAEFADSGVRVEQHLQPVQIIVDPGLLVGLLEAAVRTASTCGQVLTLWLKIKNWPEHALLTIKARPHVATQHARGHGEDEATELEWVLLLQLAEAMGVTVTRDRLADHQLFTMEFPRTVKQLEGMTAVEMDAGGDSSLLSESKPLAGHRLLLVTQDSAVAAELREIARNMNLVLDVVSTTLKAVRFCELDKPHAILVDEHLQDQTFDELREDLLRYDVNFPFIEIAAGRNIVEVSSWMGDRMSRISRDALRTQLPSMLVMELAKVF